MGYKIKLSNLIKKCDIGNILIPHFDLNLKKTYFTRIIFLTSLKSPAESL